MSKIISIHSFRGGTGKSNTTANVTALLAASGLRIGVIDTDLQSPGIHVLFGVDEEKLTPSLNDYLWGKCEIEEAAQDVTPLLGVPISGQVFLIPASMKPGEITRIVNQGYDPGLLS
ncbi:MAG TPA: P-loop NTPase, partial [Roseiflexaceae bacterium]|nr:P-loop NTPase [Roseiflexaceae bacterium]